VSSLPNGLDALYNHRGGRGSGVASGERRTRPRDFGESYVARSRLGAGRMAGASCLIDPVFFDPFKEGAVVSCPARVVPSGRSRTRSDRTPAYPSARGMSRCPKRTSGPHRASVGTDKAGRIFLRNHAAGIASIDLFVVSTISFKLLSKLEGIDKLDVHR
jgi:hypothetical protein